MAKAAKTAFQLGALVLLLIVFPAASWYYLNSGLQYRRTTMAELKEYGTFPSETWTLVDGSRLSEEFLQKKMLLAHVMPDEAHQDLAAKYGNTLRQLHDQFEEREELVFLTLVPVDSIQQGPTVKTFAKTYQLAQQKQQFFVQVDTQRLAALRASVLQPGAEILEEPQAYFLLTDTTATIRRYYDIREESDIKRLVEHIALLLPFKKDRELIFKREAEK